LNQGVPGKIVGFTALVFPSINTAETLKRNAPRGVRRHAGMDQVFDLPFQVKPNLIVQFRFNSTSTEESAYSQTDDPNPPFDRHARPPGV
jgi:hypothetical protein